jgi:LuxR family transcriptional regulator, maltose regulon positive regulatory protein
MSASTRQPAIRRERRIIERPRLTKLLDESEARIILLLAPAGYGKTTLARQWAKTLNNVVWVSCTPAHRDVVTFAQDFVSQLGDRDDPVARRVEEIVASQDDPVRASRRLAVSLADQLGTSRCNWVVIDDYHEISGSDTENLIEGLQINSSARYLLNSRVRPSWERSRSVVYGDAQEIGRETLAMTNEETLQLLGRRTDASALARQAEGWPAVLGLASVASDLSPPTGVLPDALHRYFAEEIYQRASQSTQAQLIALALLPSLSRSDIEAHLDVDANALLAQAHDLGFLSGDEPTMHPLLREFLLDRLSDRDDVIETVGGAIDYCLKSGYWSWALDLINRFKRYELVEEALQVAFKPLIRSGRIATLAAFASGVRLGPSFPPPALEVVEAEAALRGGQLELASVLAQRVRESLDNDHPLRSRACTIVGQSSLLLASYTTAREAFSDASASALDDVDESEALNGLALAKIFSEEPASRDAVSQLLRRKRASPTDIVRANTAELVRRRLNEGVAGPLSIDEAAHALPSVQDPRARTAFTYNVAYTLALRGDYRSATPWVEQLTLDVREHELAFAIPHYLWTAALVKLGLRRFGESERLLQELEDFVAIRQDPGHIINARILRARLLIQTGSAEEAVRCTTDAPTGTVMRAWRGEYLATRALAFACSGDYANALREASAAEEVSRGVEVRVFAEAARATVAANGNRAEQTHSLIDLAGTLGAWDPALCALRGSTELAAALASHEVSRRALEDLYARSGDLGLARRAGFRTRATRSPQEILSPRELEVLGLVARGLKNRDIARALFISESTAKVHVRHILEKLGVRSRAQAVSRYEMFASNGRTLPE